MHPTRYSGHPWLDAVKIVVKTLTGTVLVAVSVYLLEPVSGLESLNY
jgi:hypothetical protein